MKNGSRIFAESLTKHNVEHVFGVPGGTILDLIDDLDDIEFVSTRHEECAGFMASGYGLVRHMPGVACVRGGPGAANLVISVANAFQCHYPLIAVSGQIPMHYIGQPIPQFLDHLPIFRGITKNSSRITDGTKIPDYLNNAFTLAMKSPPGPVHLDFPMDIQKMEIEEVPPAVEKKVDEPDKPDISELVRLINEADFPVIIACWESLWQGCSQEISQLSEFLQIPVFCTRNALGIINPDHILFGGIVAKMWKTTLTPPAVSWALEQSDLVLMIGSHDFEIGPRFPLPPSVKAIFISSHPLEFKSQFDFFQELVCNNLKSTLQQIIQSVTSRQISEKHRTFIEMKNQWVNTLNSLRTTNSGLDIIETINEVLDKNSVVSLDVGIHAILATRHLKIKSAMPGAWLFPGGFYPMGFSFPAAVGAKFADKANEKTVLSLTGDGAFSMVMGDLETVARYELPIVVVVFNDSAYGLIKFEQLEFDKKIRGVDLKINDFVKIARGLGAEGTTIDPADINHFKTTLKEAISSQRPIVIDVRINLVEGFQDLLEKSGEVN